MVFRAVCITPALSGDHPAVQDGLLVLGPITVCIKGGIVVGHAQNEIKLLTFKGSVCSRNADQILEEPMCA